MTHSRRTRSRDYKEKKGLTLFGRLILPLTLIMALALLYLSVKLFFFAPEKDGPPLLPQRFQQAEVSSSDADEKAEIAALPENNAKAAQNQKADDAPRKTSVKKTTGEEKKTKAQQTNTQAAKAQTKAQSSKLQPKNEAAQAKQQPKGGAALKKENISKPAPRQSAEEPGGERWDVQIGGFAAKEGAEITVKQAKESGYAPYVVESVLNGKPFYKVRVAGSRDKAASQELAGRLEKAGFPVYLVQIKK
ncbi:SPOR domain-containing protein [Synergistes jonesii]|uniref:SPOR domain-containing protein n=1 Tax=Synergistes jonesii TaxID=2754 RepID=UPI00248DC6F5|nr:SPOR domain-containing protein [Synergistes jonesii]